VEFLDNQEDSLIVNKAAVERGLFDGSKFTFYKTEFEQKEELGNPDASKTDGIKSANYEKLSAQGVVTKGQHIFNDDVLIGRYMPVPKGKDEKYVYTDRSIIYKDSEEAIVHNVIVDRNEDWKSVLVRAKSLASPSITGNVLKLRETLGRS
jgi:DNA-directed RNA polymerase II subunit RPB2